MSLKTYFENAQGTGVLSTSDNKGLVDAAVYARPHIFEDETLAFIMTNRRTYKNVQENPHAVYLFKEAANGYNGKRLYLTKIREEQDTELLQSLRRRTYSDAQEAKMKPLHLVFFRLDEERSLISSDKEEPIF